MTPSIDRRSSHVRSVAVVAGMLVATDQVSKAWAWRHLDSVRIDSGGGLLVVPDIGAWFQDRVVGAGFDLVNAVLLVAAWFVLLRRPRSVALLGSGTVMLAGWTSNLADRLGLHYWTAPGSVRGVTDFLKFDGRTWNAADFAIMAGSLGVVLCLAVGAVRPHRRPNRRQREPVRRTLARRGPRVAAATGFAGTLALTVTGAVAFGELSAPAIYFAASK